jgi:hypothetical protein
VCGCDGRRVKIKLPKHQDFDNAGNGQMKKVRVNHSDRSVILRRSSKSCPTIHYALYLSNEESVSNKK